VVKRPTKHRPNMLNDALIVCCDGLRRAAEANTAARAQADVQTCFVHLVRNALRKVYTDTTLDAVEQRFEEFEGIRGEHLPAMIRVWRDA